MAQRKIAALRPSTWAVAHGFTAGAVTRAIAKGEIVTDESGQVVPAHPNNIDWVDRARKHPMAQRTTRKQAEKYPVLSGRDRDDNMATDGGISEMDRTQVEKIKTVAQIKQIQQKTEIQRGDFVKRDLTSKVLAKFFAVDQSEFLPLASRMATAARGICACDDDAKIRELREYGEAECWKIIQHCKRLMNDFLMSIDGELVD